MPLIVFTVEKSREIDAILVRRILESAISLGEPIGYKASLVVYGERAHPLVDPTLDWGIIPRAYAETPILGKSPNLLEALRETREILDLEDSFEPRITLIIWSASVKPKHRVDLVLKSLEYMGVKYKIIALRPSLPGWIKYYPEILENTITYRSNMNIEKLYQRIIMDITR
ncbi:MAG: hypothetical protein QXO93_02440 [Acidilobaceae archaeon]